MTDLFRRVANWTAKAVGVRQPMGSEYVRSMRGVLERLRMAELQLSQASSLEELDLGRSALQQAMAQLQHLVRMAKREQGLPLRTVTECEELHRILVNRLNGRRQRRRTSSAG